VALQFTGFRFESSSRHLRFETSVERIREYVRDAKLCGLLRRIRAVPVAVPRITSSPRCEAGRRYKVCVAGFLLLSKRAGDKGYSWHCNRHPFASRLVMAGVDLRTVAELLGHRTLRMAIQLSGSRASNQCRGSFSLAGN
jgi:hypothetical protein